MKKSNTSVYIAFALIIIAANFYVSWQIFLPKYKDTKSDIATANAEISSAREKLDSLKTAQTSLNSLGDVPDKLLTAVPEDVDVPNLISELEALSVKHNTIIPAIQISDSGSTAQSYAKASPTNGVPVAFSVAGDYATLMQFLTSLEKDIRYMNAKSLSLSVGEKEKMSMSLQLEVFKRTNTSLSAQASGLTGNDAASASSDLTAASATGTGGEE